MLTQKKVIVFGASGLLGTNVTINLLNQGSHVVAVDINFDILQEKLNQVVMKPDNKLELIVLDITSESSVVNFFLNQSGITGVVNCSYPRNQMYGTHFLDVSLSSFNENLSMHLGTSFLLMQQSAKYFNRFNSEFSFVNIASVYGVVPPDFNVYQDTEMTMPVEYAAIKSAIIHLNKYVVKYINNSLFRVNSISPGGIINGQPDVFLNKYKALTHGKGMLDAEDILGSISFLLSDDAKYITGQNIIIDDGFSI